MARPKKEQVPDVPKGSAVVFDKGGNYIRTYSLEEHGKNFGDLAKQFISKKGREGYSILER